MVRRSGCGPLDPGSNTTTAGIVMVENTVFIFAGYQAGSVRRQPLQSTNCTKLKNNSNNSRTNEPMELK